jgi:hypothetical protein
MLMIVSPLPWFMQHAEFCTDANLARCMYCMYILCWKSSKWPTGAVDVLMVIDEFANNKYRCCLFTVQNV